MVKPNCRTHARPQFSTCQRSCHKVDTQERNQFLIEIVDSIQIHQSMLNISLQTKLKDILKEISVLREEKGREEDVAKVIEKALRAGHDWEVNLLFEKALNYQHMVMNEEAKNENDKDLVARKTSLLNMEETILEAKFYIEKYKLMQWKSRIHRFLGRLYDYKNESKKAIAEYEKALTFVNEDPDYAEKKIPRNLELEAFLAYSTLQSGDMERGLEMSRRTYEKFNKTVEGKRLKKKDYVTWAIWKSGVSIRTIKALLEQSVEFDKKVMLNWLNEAEKDLNPINKKLWSDFSYRKNEINSIKLKLI